MNLPYDQGVAAQFSQRVAFGDLYEADLDVDAVYEGGTAHNKSDDPIQRLLKGVGNSGGFRPPGKATPKLVALCSSGANPDWPDELDHETGIYTYYGDNRRPGRPLLKTRGGNLLLQRVFDAIHLSPHQRDTVPPFFVFEATGTGWDNRFLGLAVPGAPQVEQGDDLVAIWRTTGSQRFQNYRATFSILKVPTVPREWIAEVEAGVPLGVHCPSAFRKWIETGQYEVLRSQRTQPHREPADQLPATKQDMAILQAVHERFRDDPYGFEGCAALLWRMQQGPDVTDLRLTRPSVDGGHDAVGYLRVGPASDPIRLDFVLEAKCYEPGGGRVRVKDMARLISRLRHRQFGVLVTTNLVDRQAYKEVRADEHPIVIISGRDIVDILRRSGHGTPALVKAWLARDFRSEFS